MVDMLGRVWLLLAVAAGIASAADVRVVEQIVAKVNGDIITLSEIERTRTLAAMELKQKNLPPPEFSKELDERQRDALRAQIDELLLVQKAKEIGINVDPDVTRRLAEIQIQSKINDPDQFQRWIREQAGMPYEDFKSQMKNSLLTQRVVRQEVGGRINISHQEIEQYYNEHKAEFIRQEQVFLREIFLNTSGKTPEETAAIEKKAKDLVARARKGEKFPEMARDNSESETAKNYGELGWWKRGELSKQIEDIVFKENRGYVTDPIKMDNGFEILKIEERHEKGQASLDEVENEITEKLFAPRMEPRVREYLTKLREEAFLEIREGFVDSGAAPGKDTSWKDPAQLKPETTTKAEVASRQRKRLLGIIPTPWKKNPAPAEDDSTPAPASTTDSKDSK